MQFRNVACMCPQTSISHLDCDKIWPSSQRNVSRVFRHSRSNPQGNKHGFPTDTRTERRSHSVYSAASVQLQLVLNTHLRKTSKLKLAAFLPSAAPSGRVQVFERFFRLGNLVNSDDYLKDRVAQRGLRQRLAPTNSKTRLT